MAVIRKLTIRGKTNSTVLYQISNLRIEGDYLKFDSFRFYSPAAELIDENEVKYFDVPADQVGISRDDTLNKEIQVYITLANGAEAVEILEGATPPDISVSNEGDLVITIIIPADLGKDIDIEYKEVLCD